MGVLETGEAANSVCLRGSETHNKLPGRRGCPRVSTYPSKAWFRSGDGRVGEVRHAADIPAGVARNKSTFTAFVLEAATPALLRKRAGEKPGRWLDCLRGSPVLRK